MKHKKPTISDIENAFQPAREITNSKRFAGREQSVSDAYYGLMAEGANLAIVGNRGIGKTSLARQIINIGEGNTALLQRIGTPVDDTLDYLTVYFACGDAVKTTDDLLERLLSTSSALGDWIYDIPQAKRSVLDFSPKISAKLFGVGAELGGSKNVETDSTPAVTEHSIDTIFTNVIAAIASEKIARDGILIVIDEFDQIDDASGFARFLKSLATNAPAVKFCIVGVARDVQALMKEHGSADRLFAGSVITLPPMSEVELKEITEIAEKQIAHYITFTEDGRNRVAALAQGHPYIVHLIGKYALRAAFKANQRTIDSDAIDSAIRSIAERNADPVLEGRYRHSVASSPQREIVLKALAETQDSQREVWTTNAYKVALDKGVDNASQYVGQLTSIEYGAEIEKLRERYYRFKDSLFATYVEVRPPMFAEDASRRSS